MKHLILMLLMLSVVLSADAQRRKKDTLNMVRPGSYLVADLGGGFNTMTFKIDKYGHKNPGPGLMGRVGYRYFFTKNWGAGVDLSFKTYMSSCNFNYINTIEGAVDQDGESYQHRTYYHYLKERQKETMFGIPVGVFYQHELDKKYKIGGGLGFIAQFINTDKFITKKGSLETRSYYPQYNLEMYDMERHYLYDKDNFKGNNNLSSSYGAFGEFDFMYVLTPRIDLNFGMYFTYGFNNIHNKTDNPQFDPDCMAADAYKNPVYNGVLNSNIVDEVHPFSIGVMAGIRYRLVHTPREKPEKEEKVKPEKPEKVKPEKPGKNDKDTTKDSTKVPPQVIEDDDEDDSLVPKREERDTVKPEIPSENPVEQSVEDDDEDDSLVPKREERDTVKPDVPSENPVEQPEDVTEPEKQPSDTLKPEVPNEQPVEQPEDVTEPEKQPSDTLPKDEPEEVKINVDDYNFVFVNFDFNQTAIKANKSWNAMFDQVAGIAKQHPEIKILVIGHTCNIGTEEQNQIVAMKRAESVKQELVNRGVDASRITCESKGYSQPLVPNNNAVNRSKNRRVEIKLTE